MSKPEKESIIGRCMMPRDMIVYKEETIASRTLIMSREGTVTLFAFDKGQGLSEHTAPFDALAYALDGEAEITIAGTPHHLREGEMIIMPATIPHAVQPVTRFKMMLIMIHAGMKERAEKSGREEEKAKEEKPMVEEERKGEKKKQREERQKEKEERKGEKKKQREEKQKEKEERKEEKKKQREEKQKEKEERKGEKKKQREEKQKEKEERKEEKKRQREA